MDEGIYVSGEIRLESFVDAMFGENAYVVWKSAPGPCWIIDPGLPPSAQQIIAHIQENDLTPAALILTHGHMDHIAGVPKIREAFPEIPVFIAEDAKPALMDPNENLSAGYGLPVVIGDIETHDLPHGSELSLDGTEWLLLDTSGHAPGSRSLYCEEAEAVIVGDALFQQSIGRTDFPHSDGDALIRNIKERLLTLPDDTRVYSGHGPVTKIGDEKQFNPFLQ